MTLKTPTHPGESALYDCLEPLQVPFVDSAPILVIDSDTHMAILRGGMSTANNVAIPAPFAFSTDPKGLTDVASSASLSTGAGAP